MEINAELYNLPPAQLAPTLARQPALQTQSVDTLARRLIEQFSYDIYGLMSTRSRRPGRDIHPFQRDLSEESQGLHSKRRWTEMVK